MRLGIRSICLLYYIKVPDYPFIALFTCVDTPLAALTTGPQKTFKITLTPCSLNTKAYAPIKFQLAKPNILFNNFLSQQK